MLLVLTVLLPIISGAFLLVVKEERIKRKALCIFTGTVLCVEFILIMICICAFSVCQLDLFSISSVLKISFNLDNSGRIFAGIMGIVWLLTGFYSFEYMKHEEHNKRYFGIYLFVLGILIGLCAAGNLVTYYAFFELLTIGSFGMVLHNQSREAIMASLKYMFYSFAGAYMVLFGLYFVYNNANDTFLTFTEGGIMSKEVIAHNPILLVSMLLMIIGFSVKAGMFPMQGWLPTAHPVAPAPASAVLSGIIVKAGVLGVIRVIYYIFGAPNFSGTYVQTVVIILSLITVFLGSMLAYREKILKKRLAYSTVSQVSYILFGLFVVNTEAMQGAVLHVVSHALIKSTLFLCAGAIIYITGATKVDDLRGIGKKMPVMLWCYTIVSLGLIGIPPMGGFVSKWYLCVGALNSGIKLFGVLGPVILLISALLTAGYLLPISINGFLPGKDFVAEDDSAAMKAAEPKMIMLIPIIIMTVLSVLIGIYPEVLL